MRSALQSVLFVGLAGMFTMATACGDDSGAGGAAGTGGSDTGSGGDATTTTTSSTTTSSTTTSSTTTSSTTTSSTSTGGEGGSGTTTGQGGAGGGTTTGQGGGGTTTGQGGAGGGGTTTTGQGGGGQGNCTAITFDELVASGNRYGANVTPNVDAGTVDVARVEFWTTDFNGDPVDPAGDLAGTYDLANEPSYFDCARCILGFVNPDVDGVPEKIFFQQSGTLTLQADGNDVLNGNATYSLADVVLAEATIDDLTGETVFVPNGECLYVASATFDDPIVPATAFTLDSGAIDVAIPDDDVNGATVDIVSTEVGTVVSIDSVVVELDHTFAGDVQLILEAPEGGDFFTIFLENPQGGLADANFESTTPITFDPTSLVGASEIGVDLLDDDVVGLTDGVDTFFPEPESFDFLVDANVNGTWHLYAFDSAGGDVGSIARVTITGTRN